VPEWFILFVSRNHRFNSWLPAEYLKTTQGRFWSTLLLPVLWSINVSIWDFQISILAKP